MEPEGLTGLGMEYIRRGLGGRFLWNEGCLKVDALGWGATWGRRS